MTAYRVTFYKELVNSEGHPFKCPQHIVLVRRAKSQQRALLAAQRRIERRSRCRWTVLADFAAAEPLASARPTRVSG
ncbi:MAG TPA: hypothetical protein VFQ27_03010 [Xanthobacteraceae bacterium]|nr:hypothetical protein [Xanthobacteraceae bacterium]